MAGFLASVMKLPRNCIEESNKTGLADTSTEERVCCKSAERVVTDFGVGWGSASVNEGEIVVGR